MCRGLTPQYAAARVMVRKAGELVGIELRPHDLRRHAATYASRSGVPIEIMSKHHKHLGKVLTLDSFDPVIPELFGRARS